jgi:UDP-glucuronate 4-epimerase
MAVMRYLVTGGAGFIGSHVVDRLLAAGHAVAAVDAFDDFYDRRTKEANLRSARANPRLTFLEFDLRDAAAVASAFAAFRPDCVIHLAARAGVRPSIENPRLYFDINVGGTLNVLEAARRHGPRKVVFAGSSSVYGNQEKVPFSEDDPTDRPISPYAATKKMGEQLCHTYHAAYGLSVTCLRFFSVYGPRGRPDMAVAKFVRAVETGETVTMYGDGGSSRDYTYIDDIVDGILAAADRCDGYAVYNLGRSEPVTLSELVAAISAALGKAAKTVTLPPKPGDVERTFADVSRGRAALGYEPRVSLQEGLARYVAWYRQNAGASGE